MHGNGRASSNGCKTKATSNNARCCAPLQLRHRLCCLRSRRPGRNGQRRAQGKRRIDHQNRRDSRARPPNRRQRASALAKNSANSASLITGMPSDCALASLLPARSPATTREVFAETLPATRARPARPSAPWPRCASCFPANRSSTQVSPRRRLGACINLDVRPIEARRKQCVECLCVGVVGKPGDDVGRQQPDPHRAPLPAVPPPRCANVSSLPKVLGQIARRCFAHLPECPAHR